METGSTVWIADCTFDFGQGDSICGESVQVRVVGVTRTERDLLPRRRQPPPGNADQQDSEFGVFAGTAWYESFGKDSPGFVQTAFRLAPGAVLDDVRADVEAGLPDGWTIAAIPAHQARRDDLIDSLRNE